jgi:CRP-like cAMP-binding protein
MIDSFCSELLKHSTLVRDLTPEQCDELSEIMDTRKLKDGEMLIEQGEHNETMFIVADGGLAVERTSSGGDELVLHILKPGDLAGEMGFIDGSEHSATLRAKGNTTVVCLRRSSLESILSSKPSLVYGFMCGVVRTVHRILREMNMQYVELNNYITKTHGRY